MNCGNLFCIYQEFTSEDLLFFLKWIFLRDLPEIWFFPVLEIGKYLSTATTI